MIEVSPGLFVGAAADEEAVRGKPGWFIVSAAKEPWHRLALGYAPGKAAPKDDPERLLAYRDGTLILNLIDAADPKYIPDEIVDAALEAIKEARAAGLDVLVHCNQGGSRSPTLALLYLHKHGAIGALPDDFELALDFFGQIYVPFAPAKGMLEYARAHW